MVRDQLELRVCQELDILRKRMQTGNLNVETRRQTGQVSHHSAIEILSEEDVFGHPSVANHDADVVAVVDTARPSVDASTTATSGATPLISLFPFRGRHVPLYRLYDLLDSARHPSLDQSLSAIAYADRLSSYRHALANDQIVTREPTREDSAERIQNGAVMALRSGSDISGNGSWTVDLAVALWRLRLWLCQGWDRVIVDDGTSQKGNASRMRLT